MESISPLLLRLEHKPSKCKWSLRLEKPLLSRKFKCNKNRWPTSQQFQLSQLNRKKMMDISRLSRRSRLRWLLPKLKWTLVLSKPIRELNKCNKRMLICQISQPLPMHSVPFIVWDKVLRVDKLTTLLLSSVLQLNQVTSN